MINWIKVKSIICISAIIFSVGLNAQSFGDRLDLDPNLAPFYHGVASGDPLTDRVIIWTRITTDLNEVDVVWRVATDSLFTENVQTGSFITSANRDFTVKVDVTGLSANTYYFYDFHAIGKRSLIGRTKTAPSGQVDQYRIVFVSCSDMNTGFFNVFDRITERNDFDVVYHLGDYIYEYQDDRYLEIGLKARDVEPDHETITLADYRTRYSFYRLDPKLRNNHQQYPWVLIWDDHETANDSYKDGAQNHSNGSEGPWEDRKAAGAQAYLEWMPIRESNADPFDISRSFKIGDLAEFFALEARLTAKSKPVPLIALFPNSDNSTRGMIGHDQRNWLQDGLSNSTSKWKVVASPTVFSALYASAIARSADSWDGYPWERRQIVNHVKDNEIDNFVVLSGDVHAAFSLDIPYKIDDVRNENFYNHETGDGSIGVNFVVTGASSGLCCRNGVFNSWKENNPHLKYANFKQNGYALIDITKEKLTCDYFYVDTVHIEEDTSHFWDASWCVFDSVPHLQNCNSPSVYNGAPFPFAPGGVATTDTTVTDIQVSLGEIIGVYPVPAIDFVGIQFFLQKPSEIVIDIFDLSGRRVITEDLGSLERGVHINNIRLNRIAKGEYVLNIRNNSNILIASRRIIKQ